MSHRDYGNMYHGTEGLLVIPVRIPRAKSKGTILYHSYSTECEIKIKVVQGCYHIPRKFSGELSRHMAISIITVQMLCLEKICAPGTAYVRGRDARA